MKYDEITDDELVELAREDEIANEELYQKYKPLIISIAKKHYKKTNNSGLDLSDLIQEAMIGLNDAISHYDAKKDTIFYTYARKCIESQILSALKKNSTKKNQLLNTSVSIDDTLENNTSKYSEFIKNIDSPEDLIINEEISKEIDQKLYQELTSLEASVYQLKLSGFNYVEISDILGINKKNVDNAIQRIKTKADKVVKDIYAN